MKDMTGKKISIAGMTIEITADAGEQWKTRNITTGETIMMDKKMLLDAVKLGKAEEVSEG